MKKISTYGLWNLFFGAIVMLPMHGCVTTPEITDPRFMPNSLFDVKVSSFAAPDAVTRAYGGKMFITSAMKNVGDNNLEFIQAAKYIENALSVAYSRVNRVEAADILIRVAYGIGSLQSTQTLGNDNNQIYKYNCLPHRLSKIAKKHFEISKSQFKNAPGKPVILVHGSLKKHFKLFV